MLFTELSWLATLRFISRNVLNGLQWVKQKALEWFDTFQNRKAVPSITKKRSRPVKVVKIQEDHQE